MENLNALLAHAVGQHGRDRTYTVRFGASTPIVDVYEDGVHLAEFWLVNGVVHEKKFF